MVIQAVGLLDDLDKELNNYAMRLREWYGWHFPECGKIITDNLTFAKLVNLVGMRENTRKVDLGEIIDEDTEKQVKEAKLYMLFICTISKKEKQIQEAKL